jgi:hypothetical protein
LQRHTTPGRDHHITDRLVDIEFSSKAVQRIEHDFEVFPIDHIAIEIGLRPRSDPDFEKILGDSLGLEFRSRINASKLGGAEIEDSMAAGCELRHQLLRTLKPEGPVDDRKADHIGPGPLYLLDGSLENRFDLGFRQMWKQLRRIEEITASEISSVMGSHYSEPVVRPDEDGSQPEAAASENDRAPSPLIRDNYSKSFTERGVPAYRPLSEDRFDLLVLRFCLFYQHWVGMMWEVKIFANGCPLRIRVEYTTQADGLTDSARRHIKLPSRQIIK